MQQVNQQNLNKQNVEEENCVSWMFFNKALPCKTPLYLKNYARIGFLFFLILAIITFIVNSSIKSEKIIYAISNICKKTNLDSQKCSIDFTISQDMNEPVYLLYFVENIYINHKRSISSYSIEQLAGKVIDTGVAQQECSPIVLNKDLPVNVSWGGQPLDPNAVASPCGLKPFLFFNDTFRLYEQSGSQVKIDEEKVARSNDGRIKRQPQSSSKQWIDPQNEHFIAYMRTGSLMTKKRLWGRIEEGLKKGQYTLLTQNNFRVNDLEIEKGVQLTTTTAFGGKNHFFSVTFGLAALVCLGFSIFIGNRIDIYEDVIRDNLKHD